MKVSVVSPYLNERFADRANRRPDAIGARNLRKRNYIARTLHVIGWSAICWVYLVVSVPRILPSLTRGPLGPTEPFYSTDAYLEALTGTRHASSQILHALAPLPRDKMVVLVLPDAGVNSAFIAQNVTYLCWPREVRWLVADHPHAERDLFALAPSTLAAVIFWDVAPFNGLPDGIRLGQRQVIVPVHRTDSPHA